MADQTLQATPAVDAKGKVSWTLCNGKCGGPGSYPTTVVPKNAGATNFTITITDTNNTGVVFAADPMWVHPGQSCPTSQVFDSAGQIPGNKVVASPTKITFQDLNNNNPHNPPVDLAYQLNFVLKGKTVTPIDPIIQNGGCCMLANQGGTSGWSTEAFAGYVVLAFVVGIIVTLLAQRVFRSS